MFQQRVFSLLLLTCVVYSLSPRKVHLQYPTELLHPITGTSFSATVSPDKLLCFGNNDYAAPTYIETLFCMLPYIPGTSTYCNSVWGSRSVEVEVDGNIEFLRVTKLPHESSADATGLRVSDSAYALEISATRWLQYSSHNSVEHPIKELLQIPAEPLYLCARSTDWQGQYANFSMKFRPVYFRMRDKRQCNNRTLMHLALVVMVTSVWFIPYLTAFLAAVLAYEHGLKVMLTLFMVSASVVCLTPLMLTKHNRHLARQYFNYFFTRLQAKETRLQIKKRLPVFQALFFSSLLVVSGFGLVYVLYYYDFLARETRNIGFKTILSAAISWFIFSLCRSFERFLKDWLWIAMCVSLAHLLASHLNPLCRNEVVVASIVLTQALRLLLLPWMAQFETFNRIVSTALPRLENASSKLRIPLPYQIYEHHSLRHLVETDYTAGTISAANSPFSTSLSNTAATSTGDLTNLANNLRRSASSRASLAHIAEMQPLVDYIDEVMEGSICSDDGGEGCEEEQLLEEEETEEREDLVVEEVAAAVREQRGRSPSEQQRSRQVCSATADAATLWQRLCQTDLSPTRNVAAGSTASIEQRNRQALEEQWGLDVTCIPVFKASLLSSTSESSDQQDMQQAPDREVPVVASRRTRSSVKRDAVVPVEASTSPSLSQSGEPGIGRGQLIGAVHTPLSLVGPLSLRLCSPEQDPLLQTTEEDGWQAWLPLAVHEDDMVCALQAACDSVGDSAVTITRLAPLEDKLVVSSRLRCCPQQQSQEGSKSVQAGELAAWLRSDTAIWELLSAAQDEAFDVTCRVESHTTVLLQVRTRLSADAHCILDPLSAGQRILRQILWYIQRSYPSVVAVGGVLVNHSPQSAPVLLQLLPCMHVLQAECSVSLPNTTSAKALLFVHAQVDRHQADAYIIRTLLALCAAMKAESAAAELAVLVACVEFEVVRAPGCGNNADSSAVHVSARVPAMPALCSATADPAVQACLALLAPILREDNTQADDRYAGQQQTTDDSAAQQECAESASAALVLLAYLSYLTMEFTSL